MSSPNSVLVEDWSELDALVGAELDMVLARCPKPMSEPEAEEAAFLVEATAFLGRHPEPQRLITEIIARLPATPVDEPIVPKQPKEANDEPI
jgi:hypothetical protein